MDILNDEGAPGWGGSNLTCYLPPLRGVWPNAKPLLLWRLVPPDQLILTQLGPLNSDNYSDIRESIGTTSAPDLSEFCLLEGPYCILPTGSELPLQKHFQKSLEKEAL